MKKCTWCGSEYPDTASRCALDAQPLAGGEEPVSSAAASLEVAAAPPPIPELPADPAAAPPASRLSEMQLRVFELVLLCVIAFGTGVLSSAYYLLWPGLGKTSMAPYNWVYGALRESTTIALLWYILQRRSRTIFDLGLSWAGKDLLRSAGLWAAGTAAYGAVYAGIYFSGLTSTNPTVAGDAVGNLLFGRGVTAGTFLFQFINPFFEELIVRAYLMTEVRQMTNSAAKAVILSTVLQTSYHFYQGAPMAFSEGATFLVFSLYYARTKRITPIILAHLYMDVFATLAYMTPR